MFPGVLNASILKRAQDKKLVEIHTHQLRDWATDKHRTVDDSPYGGGPGMILKVDVVDRALHDLKLQVATDKSQVRIKQKEIPTNLQPKNLKTSVILMTPQGRPFSQTLVQKLAKKSHLILIAGHYEGFDERIRALVNEEISIGDYVLTGGEIPAMVLTDAVTRLLPGVLGNDTSSHEESFSDFGFPSDLGRPAETGRISDLQSPQRLLEYPHYTRPETYKPISRPNLGNLAVPEILKNGHHAEIEKWRHNETVKRTQKRRPDLLK